MVLERMLPRSLSLLILLLMSAAACQMMPADQATPTLAPTPTPDTTPSPEPAHEGDWEQVQVGDVMLGLEVPYGWKSQKTDSGLLIAQKFGTMQSGAGLDGTQIYIFVYPLESYANADTPGSNRAWTALRHIIEQPEMIGAATVSQPAGFEWDGHDAAYYLLNDGQGSMSMLLAVAVSNPLRLVVCNFTAPAADAAAIRQLVPQLLHTLTVNGDTMDSGALNDLPDPLEFPQPQTTHTPNEKGVE